MPPKMGSNINYVQDNKMPEKFTAVNPGLSIGSGAASGTYWIDEVAVKELPQTK